MKILITGANGFVGRNVLANLKLDNEYELFAYDIDTGDEKLRKWTKECDFVIHLAGVNRPKTEDEFAKGNTDFTSYLLDLLKENPVPVAMTSSIQAALDIHMELANLGRNNYYLITVNQIMFRFMFGECLTFLESGVGLIITVPLQLFAITLPEIRKSLFLIQTE